jgi:hypothetical protein
VRDAGVFLVKRLQSSDQLMLKCVVMGGQMENSQRGLQLRPKRCAEAKAEIQKMSYAFKRKINAVRWPGAETHGQDMQQLS